MSGVEVLDNHDLEASGAALAGSNNGPGEEELPDLQFTNVSEIDLAVVVDT